MRYSIRTLLKATFQELNAELRLRCKQQLLHVAKLPSLKQVGILQNLYSDTVKDCLKFSEDKSTPKHTQLSAKAMSKLREDAMLSLETRHASVVETLADIVAKEATKSDRGAIIDHISSILHTHLGNSILISHMASISTSGKHYSKTGCIDSVNLMDIVLSVKFETMLLIEHHYNYCPAIEIEILTSGESESKRHGTITCVPSIVSFAIKELLKNAASSTIEQFCKINEIPVDTLIHSCDLEDIALPPIRVTISYNNNQATIAIIDTGLGISDTKIIDTSSPFFVSHYLFPFSQQHTNVHQASYQPMTAPCKGFGCGLYMSFFYTEHFGGKLRLFSNGAGEGCTAIISIPFNLDLPEPPWS